MDIMKKEIDQREFERIPMGARMNQLGLLSLIGPLRDREDIYYPFDVYQDPNRYSLIARFKIHTAYPNPDIDW